MKKNYILILLVTFMSFHFSYIRAACDGDTLIVIKPANQPETIVPNRGISPPISAYYDAFSSSLVISFSTDIGDVRVSLTNLLTEVTIDEVINAFGQREFIPVYDRRGVFLLEFVLSNGDVYVGLFNIGFYLT